MFVGKEVDETGVKNLTSTEEALIFHASYLADIGPKLFGVFNGGRVEEYIPSHRITDDDFEDPRIVTQLARKLARFHALQPPISKKPRDVYKAAEMNYAQYDASGFQTIIDYIEHEDGKALVEFDWRSEIEWTRNTEPKINGRFVLVQGDMDKNNVLVRDEPDTFNERVILIDYEFAAIDYRGRDFGKFFPLKTIETSDQGIVKFVSEYPDEKWRHTFITKYLRMTKELATNEFDEQGLDSVDHLMMEADFFVLSWIVTGLGFFMKQGEDSFILKMSKEHGRGYMVRYLNEAS